MNFEVAKVAEPVAGIDVAAATLQGVNAWQMSVAKDEVGAGEGAALLQCVLVEPFAVFAQKMAFGLGMGCAAASA